ncbi:hypothetical protein Tco_1160869, partial [Tanacetum coccineum]
LNDLANKERKHADDIHDYFKATKRFKLSVMYGDHLTGTVLNEPVLDLQEEAAPAGEQSGPPAPKTAKQLTVKRNQERVKRILLLAILDEYLFKFHNVPDAKSL